MSSRVAYYTIGSRQRAHARYCMIRNRVNNSDYSRNTCYADIELLLDKEEFISWFMENDFKGCSVDRINNTGDYSMDNIQLLTMAENIRKDKTKAKNGMCECYSCKEVKPLEVFAVDKRRHNGHATMCRECDNKRRRSSTGTKQFQTNANLGGPIVGTIASVDPSTISDTMALNCNTTSGRTHMGRGSYLQFIQRGRSMYGEG